MKKNTVLLLMACLCTTIAQAQFSASGDTNGAPFAVTPLVSTGLDKVYVYKNATNAVLSFTATTPSDWTWYRYAQNPATATAVPASDVQTNATQTVLNNVQSNYGYFVQSSSGIQHFCFVVGYLQPAVTDITFTTEGDVCTNLTLKVTASVDNLYYYTATALRKTLTREFSLGWNTQEWDATSKSYKTKLLNSTSTNLAYNWSVTAPLCDTYFTLTGDQIATYFGQSLQGRCRSGQCPCHPSGAGRSQRTGQGHGSRLSERFFPVWPGALGHGFQQQPKRGGSVLRMVCV
jgi:hypothetical protein